MALMPFFSTARKLRPSDVLFVSGNATEEAGGTGEEAADRSGGHQSQDRHRRRAQCRQVDLLQRADQVLGGRGELPILHDRPERK